MYQDRRLFFGGIYPILLTRELRLGGEGGMQEWCVVVGFIGNTSNIASGERGGISILDTLL